MRKLLVWYLYVEIPMIVLVRFLFRFRLSVSVTSMVIYAIGVNCRWYSAVYKLPEAALAAKFCIECISTSNCVQSVSGIKFMLLAELDIAFLTKFHQELYIKNTNNTGLNYRLIDIIISMSSQFTLSANIFYIWMQIWYDKFQWDLNWFYIRSVFTSISTILYMRHL